jgi:two-component system CheB/CheR fusion protein
MRSVSRPADASPVADDWPAAERLGVILDHAPVLIYLVDESARFLNVNSAWLEQVGLAESDLIGRSLYEVFDRATAAAFEANNRRILQSGSTMRFEEVHAGKTYLSVKVPVRNATGHAYAVCGMSVDITERVQTEQRLKESEARFETMADGLPLIVWVHGPRGEQQFVNKRFCEYFGVTLDEMREDRWQLLTHPEDGPGYTASFMKCVEERRAFRGEVRVRRADGEWRWIESWAQPRFSPDGEFLGMVGASSDITERKENAEKLRDSEAGLRNADRRKNEFIATLAHELRNPLAAIKNCMQIVRQYDRLPRADVLATQQIAMRQVEHLARLADDLLDISRIALGRMHLRRELLDLRAVADDAIAGVQSNGPAATHAFTFDRPREPIWVEGDRVRLCQVFSNLLNNAFRYTPPSGRIEFRIGHGEGTAIASVQDDGIGLGEEELEAIFRPFVQSATAEGFGLGLGIGLTLAKQIVELHGGSIGVASKGRGAGSTFTVRLPVAQAIQPQAAAL